MGLISYSILYLVIGYVIALVGALLAPAKEAELKPLPVLVIVVGWGLVAIVLAWRMVCYPIALIARVRQRLAGGISAQNG